MTVSTYQKKKKYAFDFRHDGKRHMQGGFATKTKAQKAEKDLKKRLQTNANFASICETRLQTLKSLNTERYYRENELLIERLKKAWVDKQFITQEDVKSYVRSQLSVTQSNKELKMIKALFQEAVDNDLLETNPARRVKSQPIKKSIKYIPSQEDIIKFLITAGNDRFYFLTFIYTLARMREINKLKWENVHKDYLVLTTRKSRNSDEEPRIIPINEILKYVLGKVPTKGEYIFCREDGTPYDCRKKLMAGICKRAGIKRFSFHSLRHFGASKLVEAGAPLSAVQGILGHSRATTTDTYIQSLGTKKNEVMDNLII